MPFRGLRIWHVNVDGLGMWLSVEPKKDFGDWRATFPEEDDNDMPFPGSDAAFDAVTVENPFLSDPDSA